MIDRMPWVTRANGLSESLIMIAYEIVTWVNANDGEARYENWQYIKTGKTVPRIVVRQRDDSWAVCAPGQTIVMGELIGPDVIVKRGLHPTADLYAIRTFREFTIED